MEQSASDLVQVSYTVVRTLAFLSFAALIGGVAFVGLCWPEGANDSRASLLLVGSWCVSLLATICALLLQGVYSAGLGLSHLADLSLLTTTGGTRFGTAMVLRLVLLVLAAVGMLSIRPRLVAKTVVVNACWLLLAVAFAFTWAMSDHSSVGRQRPLALLADDAHLVAMAYWVGGLIIMIVATLRRSVATATAGRAVRTFSPYAGWCVACMIVTGSYQTWRNVGHWAALVDTTYGLLILAKIAGLLILIGLGYLARRTIGHTGLRNRTSGSTSAAGLTALRRSVSVEVVVAIAILGVTAVLVNSPTGREAYHPVVTATRSFDTGSRDGSIRISVRPGTLGPQIVRLTVLDAHHRPYSPAQITVSLSLSSQQLGPLDLDVKERGAGRYQTTPEPLSVAGTWTLSVLIRSDAFDETTVQVSVPIS